MKKLSPFQKIARVLRKRALAHEVFDDKKKAKELRGEAKLMDRLQEIDEEYHKNRK
jgi:hypothetical protein